MTNDVRIPNVEGRTARAGLILLLPVIGQFVACDQPLNSPYPAWQAGAPIYYSDFTEPPKHLDPAKSYSSDEYVFLAQIYEPPFDYHFLKRPYQLVPLTARSIPDPVYYDEAAKLLDGDSPASRVHRVVYTIGIKEAIQYQNHPCFAKAEDGSSYYGHLKPADVAHVDDLADLEKVSTRQLRARDYVTQICRLADPRIGCPIYSTMKQYIVGMEDYRHALTQRLEAIRAERRSRGGLTYDRARDERVNPIRIDYLSLPFEGVRVLDDHTYVIELKKKYPQMLYWLAMPFFAPVPQEAIDFYSQGPLLARGITIDRYPVGTGPYRFETYAPNRELVLVRNENFHHDIYPIEGDRGDAERGLLRDAGKELPFIDRIVYKLEKENLPRWNKFLQGYYDRSGIAEESFDRAISFTDQGSQLSEPMRAKDIELSTSVDVTIFYFGFNMLDPIVGGYSPQKQKLRQAISIAIDNEEWIEIFQNGRGIPPHGPIPPGIFGSIDPAQSHNPYVYDRDERTGLPKRKSLDEAKRLLVKAGFPEGRDPEGKPLTISFDTPWERAADQTRLRWVEKKVEALGLRLKINSTDYSTYRDKVRNANFQLLFWGWHADYPDPENFLFLFYGPNGKRVSGGENACNYDNPQLNHLFEKMESMVNSPGRREIIDRMLGLIQRDAPWVFVAHPESYTLSHGWVKNHKPNLMTYNTMKFVRLDHEERARKRREWNEPVYWPVLLAFVSLVLIVAPAVRVVRRNR